MKLSNLKPAWQQFRLMNSMQSLDQEEILLMIAKVDEMTTSNPYRSLINALLFLIFTFFCQGG